jgi:WD40 repeat protein
VRRLGGFQGQTFSLAVSPDARTLAASTAEPTVVLLDAATGKELRRLPPGQWRSVFLSDDLLATGAFGRQELRLWRVATGEQVRRFPGPGARNGIYRLAASPDGKVLASQEAAGRVIALSEVPSGKELWTFRVANRGTTFTFSPDSRTFALNGCLPERVLESPDEVVLMDVATGKAVRVLGRQRLHFTAIAFAPDGRALATGDQDGVVSLWERATGRRRCRFAGHGSSVASLSFSRDGRLLASGSHDRTLLVWDLSGRPAGERAAAFGPHELEALWNDLSADAERGYRAVRSLSESSRSAAFLAARLRPPPAAEPSRIASLLAGLEGDDFEAREAATAALARLGGRAEVALHKALAGKVTPEARRRMEALLEGLDPESSSTQLRRMRAVEALEVSGTAEAREVLRVLARDGDTRWLRHEAAASAERLGKRPARPVQPP